MTCPHLVAPAHVDHRQLVDGAVLAPTDGLAIPVNEDAMGPPVLDEPSLLSMVVHAHRGPVGNWSRWGRSERWKYMHQQKSHPLPRKEPLEIGPRSLGEFLRHVRLCGRHVILHAFALANDASLDPNRRRPVDDARPSTERILPDPERPSIAADNPERPRPLSPGGRHWYPPDDCSRQEVGIRHPLTAGASASGTDHQYSSDRFTPYVAGGRQPYPASAS